VADFRVRDVAAGGHGAPVVSYVDALLFRDQRKTRVVLNLGGIGNVTVLWPEDDPRPPLAFDTGPANMVLDWLATRLTGGALSCDAGGRLAAAGTADEALLAELLSDPYFSAPPPKTTGREQFGGAYAARLLERAQHRGLSPEDVMATALALTVRTVAGAIRTTAMGPAEDEGRKTRDEGRIGSPRLSSSVLRPPSLEVIAGGGGTQNPALMAGLRHELPEAQVLTHEDLGVSSKAKEALSFAILAARAIRGEPNTVPSCTGARRAVVMGKILPGANYAALMRRLFGGAVDRP
jgi:anhydro-N-acetylmuramic acid kinase